MKADGSLQMSADIMTMQFVGKGSVQSQSAIGGNTVPSTALVPADFSKNQLIAVRSPFGAARFTPFFSSGAGFYNYACAAPVGSTLEYWIFEEARMLSNVPGWGLRLRNEAGQVTYHSDYDNLRIVGLLDADTASFDPGRAYATIAPSIAGVNQTTEPAMPYTQNNLPAPDPEDGSSYPSSTRWRRQNNGKLYGAAVNGGTVSRASVSFDDVVVQTNIGPLPAAAQTYWSRSLQGMLIVDVTGL